MRILEIWGSPGERGRRHGQVLGEEIRQMRRALLAYLARVSLYVGALPLSGCSLVGPGFLALSPSPFAPRVGGGGGRRPGGPGDYTFN